MAPVDRGNAGEARPSLRTRWLEAIRRWWPLGRTPPEPEHPGIRLRGDGWVADPDPEPEPER
jgi:hypothetical protein